MDADKRRWMLRGGFLCLSIILFSWSPGCSPKKSAETIEPATTQPVPMALDDALKLIDQRADWTQLPPIDVPRHPAEKFLKDWIIVLDPGHGGEDGGDPDSRASYKRGPTGVREAHMNWRVAVLLKRLLDDAGAKVILTRNGDETVSLARRAQIANEAKADLFISLHHNAVSNSKTNYPSVWYHGEVDWSEPDLDIARYIALGLGKAMRTEVAKTSPIFSDQLMYRTGFGVLRACDVPAVLLESSFYTNPDEEQRLRDAGYNLREAYGVYVGLCEYAYGGRPTQSQPAVEMVQGSQVRLTTILSEGLPPWWGSDRNRIITSSIGVTFDGAAVPFRFDAATKQLSATFAAPSPRSESVIEVHHQNMFKHHNYPQRYLLKRSAEDLLSIEPLGPRRARSQSGTTQPTTTGGA